MKSNREETIDYFKMKFQKDLDRNAEKVAAVVAKMAAGKPGLYEYEVRWGSGVAEDIESRYIIAGLDQIDRLERGELTGKTIEDVVQHQTDYLTEQAMRVEHSSNPFACAVSLTNAEVCRNLRGEWISFGRALRRADESDRVLQIESAEGIMRRSIEDEKKTIAMDANDHDVHLSRRALAGMRKVLKEKKLSESSYAHADFWVRLDGQLGDVVILGLIGKDQHPIDSCRSEEAE